jgi:hypothetical protein
MTMPGDQGRPRASDVVGHWPALIPRELVHATVTMAGRCEAVSHAVPAVTDVAVLPEPPAAGEEPAVAAHPAASDPVTVPLVRLCLARSGDKGDTSNVGVLARSPEIYRWLRENLTGDVVGQHFKDVCQGEVERHELANLTALNFLLHESLGGGGTSSLRFDAQGKTFAQFLLSMTVTVPAALLETI